jgi:hypothetical protein
VAFRVCVLIDPRATFRLLHFDSRCLVRYNIAVHNGAPGGSARDIDGVLNSHTVSELCRPSGESPMGMEKPRIGQYLSARHNCPWDAIVCFGSSLAMNTPPRSNSNELPD